MSLARIVCGKYRIFFIWCWCLFYSFDIYNIHHRTIRAIYVTLRVLAKVITNINICALTCARAVTYIVLMVADTHVHTTHTYTLVRGTADRIYIYVYIEYCAGDS